MPGLNVPHRGFQRLPNHPRFKTTALESFVRNGKAKIAQASPKKAIDLMRHLKGEYAQEKRRTVKNLAWKELYLLQKSAIAGTKRGRAFEGGGIDEVKVAKRRCNEWLLCRDLEEKTTLPFSGLDVDSPSQWSSEDSIHLPVATPLKSRCQRLVAYQDRNCWVDKDGDVTMRDMAMQSYGSILKIQTKKMLSVSRSPDASPPPAFFSAPLPTPATTVTPPTVSAASTAPVTSAPPPTPVTNRAPATVPAPVTPAPVTNSTAPDSAPAADAAVAGPSTTPASSRAPTSANDPPPSPPPPRQVGLAPPAGLRAHVAGPQSFIHLPTAATSSTTPQVPASASSAPSLEPIPILHDNIIFRIEQDRLTNKPHVKLHVPNPPVFIKTLPELPSAKVSAKLRTWNRRPRARELSKEYIEEAKRDFKFIGENHSTAWELGIGMLLQSGRNPGEMMNRQTKNHFYLGNNWMVDWAMIDRCARRRSRPCFYDVGKALGETSDPAAERRAYDKITEYLSKGLYSEYDEAVRKWALGNEQSPFCRYARQAGWIPLEEEIDGEIDDDDWKELNSIKKNTDLQKQKHDLEQFASTRPRSLLFWWSHIRS